MNVKLKQCPWCRSSDIAVGMDNAGEVFGLSAFCLVCECNGPLKNTEQEAAVAWNTRPPDPKREALVEVEQRIAELQAQLAVVRLALLRNMRSIAANEDEAYQFFATEIKVAEQELTVNTNLRCAALAEEEKENGR